MKEQAKHLLLLIGIIFLVLPLITFTSYIEATPIKRPVRKELVINEPILEEAALPIVSKEVEEVVILPIIEVSEEKMDIRRSLYKELIEQNSDYRGWVNLQGTAINYPFVKGVDNDYYLNHSFDKSYDPAGTIFMDYRNLGFGFSQHILLYGHYMKDGSMFRELENYKDADYAMNGPLIEIEDLYGVRYYQVYASYYAEARSDFIRTSFEDQADYETFIETQIMSSDFDYSLRPTAEDHILTLVTCSYEVNDGRYFLHAVEIK